MNKDIKLPHGGLIIVSDGRKALFLKNRGDDMYPNLQVERVLQAPESEQMHQQEAGRPGRPSPSGRRSTSTQPGWHDLMERKFAGKVAEEVNAACFRGAVKAIVVAAPPRTLAELRSRFSDAVKQRILAELNKELTKHPVHDIEQHLVAGG